MRKVQIIVYTKITKSWDLSADKAQAQCNLLSWQATYPPDQPSSNIPTLQAPRVKDQRWKRTFTPYASL